MRGQLPDLARDSDRQRENDERIAWAVTMLAATVALAVVWPIAAVMMVTVAAAWAPCATTGRGPRRALLFF
jgi:hypothetical protein